MACPVQIRSGLARAWQPAGVPQNRALMPGRVTPQITVQAGRVAAWWARMIKARGRRSSPQRDPPRLRWPGRWWLCPAAQTRRQRRRPLTKPGRPWRSANESGCAWRDGPAGRPPWREVILACRPWQGDMTGTPELPGSLTGHGWARFRGSARRISSFPGKWAAYLLSCQEITSVLLKMTEHLTNPWCQPLTCQDVAQQCAAVVGVWRHREAKTGHRTSSAGTVRVLARPFSYTSRCPPRRTAVQGLCRQA